MLLFGADTAATNQQTRVGLSSEMGWSEEENQRITNVNGRTEAGEVAHVDGMEWDHRRWVHFQEQNGEWECVCLEKVEQM